MARTTTFRSRLSLLGLLSLAFAVAPAQAQQTTRAETHTVRSGDTLWALARQYLGDAFLWPQIFRLNTSVVEDPHWIYPGEVLRLVAAEGVSAVPDEETPAPVADPAEVPAARSQERQAPDAEYPMPEFAQRRALQASEALTSYVDMSYRSLRPGEFYSSGFLTEGVTLPFGQLVGAVTPQQIRNLSERASVTLNTVVGVRPPTDGNYAVGDSLLVGIRGPEYAGHGVAVVPTGLIVVTGMSHGQYLAEVVAVFGPMRNGQFVLPAERFSEGPSQRAVALENGVVGEVIGGRDLKELKHPQNVIFINLGRNDGLRAGDVMEVRRRPEARTRSADLVDELMATGQVVRVGERTATVLLLSVVSPDIAPGTPVRHVARLPNGPDR